MEKNTCKCCNGTGKLSDEELEDFEYYYGFLNEYPMEEREAVKSKLVAQGRYFLPDEMRYASYSGRTICELATGDKRIITTNKLSKTLKAFIYHLKQTGKY